MCKENLIEVQGIQLTDNAIKQIGFLQGEYNLSKHYNEGLERAGEILFKAFDCPDNIRLNKDEYSLVMKQIYSLKELVTSLSAD